MAKNHKTPIKIQIKLGFSTIFSTTLPQESIIGSCFDHKFSRHEKFSVFRSKDVIKTSHVTEFLTMQDLSPPWVSTRLSPFPVGIQVFRLKDGCHQNQPSNRIFTMQDLSSLCVSTDYLPFQ